MVSFSCEGCGDVLTKKKLDGHYNQCRAPFTCLDCMKTFYGTEFRSHTACISEDQKYQGHLYREKDKKDKGEKRKSLNGQNGSQAMIPRGAYVEDAPDGEDQNAVAVIDVPPPCPTPPPAAAPVGELPESVNVFDFLVSEETPNGGKHAAPAPYETRTVEPPKHLMKRDSQYSQYSQYSNGDGSQYLQEGFSYGHAPVQPGFERYDSWHNMVDSEQSAIMPPPTFVTPGPKEHRREKKEKLTEEKSDKKRKRNVEDLDLSSAKRPGSRDAVMADAPVTSSGGRNLHSGLTGGLSRLVTDPEFFGDRIEAGPTPISPIKRSKREKNFKDAMEEKRRSSYVSYASSKVSSSKHTDDRHRPSSRTAGSERHDQDADRKRDRIEDKIVEKPKSSKRRDSFSSDEHSRASSRRHPRAIDYPDRPGSVQPTANNQLVQQCNRAELFMSFVNKGPDSSHGCSINKALKRYHRERNVRGEEKEDEDKELWKSLRLRRNSRGEIVLFTE